MSKDPNNRLPIIAHESLGADCCGCLVARVMDGIAEIVCNECGAVIDVVPTGWVELTFAGLLFQAE